MKILAVIPACEGSKSMPNKNIRTINGKPMIYYVINNAKKSKYITDVIVTTNSDEIITIAGQMGVKVKKRSEDLCNAQVSLDTVVYDLNSELDFADYEYVITMQSISPTLKTSTLDDAIKQCIENRLDTMVSVTNRANFYWERKEGEVLPKNPKRMNKHQLPPLYMESGAFLITKSSFITPSSRIGEKCDVYELESEEALDVFTFGDLKQAENILSKKEIAFYVNGNNQTGLGHIYRVLQLADELFTKPDIYFDSNLTKAEFFGDIKYNLCPVNGEKELVAKLKTSGCEVLINDILSTSKEYMESLKRTIPNLKIVNFEDEGEGAALADIVFNALYEKEYASNVKVGSDYYIAPKQFLLCEPVAIKEHVKDVLVTFGGADPKNYTDMLLEIAKKEKYNNIRFHFILGKAKKNYSAIMQEAKENIEILYDVNNMPVVMSRCDVAFTSRGRTGFELAMLGIPSVSIAQNEREQRHDFMSEKNGFIYLGIDPEPDMVEKTLDNLVNSDSTYRSELQRKMLSKNLYNGRKHIMNLIDNL